jgi:hypothetical protein
MRQEDHSPRSGTLAPTQWAPAAEANFVTIVACANCGKVLTINDQIPLGRCVVGSENGDYCSMKCADKGELMAAEPRPYAPAVGRPARKRRGLRSRTLQALSGERSEPLAAPQVPPAAEADSYCGWTDPFFQPMALIPREKP